MLIALWIFRLEFELSLSAICQVFTGNGCEVTGVKYISPRGKHYQPQSNNNRSYKVTSQREAEKGGE